MVGVRYKKDCQAQPFVIFHYSDFDSPNGSIELKEAVKAYLMINQSTQLSTWLTEFGRSNISRLLSNKNIVGVPKT